MAAMGELIAASCDLDGLLALARRALPLPGPVWDPAAAVADAALAAAAVADAALPDGPPVAANPVVALAAGAAFTFGYTEQAELLTAAGAGRRPVRPAARRGPATGHGRPDPRRRIPRGARGRAVRQPAAACSGGRAGRERRPDRGRMRGPALPGPHARRPSHVRRAGRRRGHDAPADPGLPHRYRVGRLGPGRGRRPGARPRVPPHRRRPARGPTPAWGLPSGEVEGHITGTVVASYLHTHWAGHPSAATRFADAVWSRAEVPR